MFTQIEMFHIVDTRGWDGDGPVEAVAADEELPGQGQGGKPAHYLQYGVREGREASEPVMSLGIDLAECEDLGSLQEGVIRCGDSVQ